MKRTLAAVTLLVTAVAPPAAAQLPERLEGALTAIFARNDYAPESFGDVVWVRGGGSYVRLQDDGLTSYDTATGAASRLVAAAELQAAGRIASISLSRDESKILLFTNTRKVWRLLDQPSRRTRQGFRRDVLPESYACFERGPRHVITSMADGGAILPSASASRRSETICR